MKKAPDADAKNCSICTSAHIITRSPADRVNEKLAKLEANGTPKRLSGSHECKSKIMAPNIWKGVRDDALTVVGRQKDTETPCMARNIINWIPDLANPHARTKTSWRKQLAKNIVRLPTRSAMEPARMRKHPVMSLSEISGLLWTVYRLLACIFLTHRLRQA